MCTDLSLGGVTHTFCVKMLLLFILSASMCSNPHLPSQSSHFGTTTALFCSSQFLCIFLSSALSASVTTKSGKAHSDISSTFLPAFCMPCRTLTLWHLAVQVHNFSYCTKVLLVCKYLHFSVQIPPFKMSRTFRFQHNAFWNKIANSLRTSEKKKKQLWNEGMRVAGKHQYQSPSSIFRKESSSSFDRPVPFFEDETWIKLSAF